MCILCISICMYIMYNFYMCEMLRNIKFVLLNTRQWPYNLDYVLPIDIHYGAIPEESKPPPPARFAPDTTTDTLRNNDARAKIWCTTAFTATINTPDQTCWKTNCSTSLCQVVFQLLFGLNSIHKILHTASLSIWKTMPPLIYHMTLQHGKLSHAL